MRRKTRDVEHRVVSLPAYRVQQVVRWMTPTLFEEEFYFDAVAKGRALGFRVGLDDINENNPTELIKSINNGIYNGGLVKEDEA